jgi:hypothetical protein
VCENVARVSKARYIKRSNETHVACSKFENKRSIRQCRNKLKGVYKHLKDWKFKMSMYNTASSYNKQLMVIVVERCTHSAS